MRVLTTRLALGALALGSICALADTAQAGPLRRLFGGRGAGASAAYGGGYDACGCEGGYASAGMYGGGMAYGQPMGYGQQIGYSQPMMSYSSGTFASSTPCCGQGNVVYGGAQFQSGYGASMYFPSQTYGYAQQGYGYAQPGYGYAQPMPYAGGGYQTGYPQGTTSGAIPAGGFIPGQLPSRSQEGVHEGSHEATGTDNSPSEAKKVKIGDSAFEPADLNVKVGTTVKWTNDDKKPHTVTSDKGDWGSNELAPGQTFTATFTKAGTFEYHCELHKDMKGTITVK